MAAKSCPEIPFMQNSASRQGRAYLKRITITYEVLAPEDFCTDELDLAELMEECHDGECSGRSLGHTTVGLSLAEAKDACARHGTDPDFFDLPKYAIGTRVHWTDPDDDICSADAVVVDHHGDGVHLCVNTAGGEIECYANELKEIL